MPAHSGSNHSFICVLVQIWRSYFDTPMPFLNLFRVPPFLPLWLRIGKKVLEILLQGRLIAFGKEQVVSLKGRYRRTPFLLCVYRICTDESPFDQSWMHQGCCRTDLIFFGADG